MVYFNMVGFANDPFVVMQKKYQQKILQNIDESVIDNAVQMANQSFIKLDPEDEVRLVQFVKLKEKLDMQKIRLLKNTTRYQEEVKRHENGTNKDKSKNQKLKKYEYYYLSSILTKDPEENKDQEDSSHSINYGSREPCLHNVDNYDAFLRIIPAYEED